MSSTITLKATGLNTSPNQLELPEGSLTEAKNVLIRRDNVIEPVRGFKLYGASMGSPTDRTKTLFEYRDRIFRHYDNVLEFQNGRTNDGIVDFSQYAASVLETETGLRIKKIESNGNLYFTTSEGIKKLAAVDSTGLASASITQAGGVKALDFTATLQVDSGDQSSFLPQDSTVAYRHVWATKDVNGNLIAGTPSQREEVYLPLSYLLIRDYSKLLQALDGVSNATGSLVSDGNYVTNLKLPVSATAVEIQTNLVALATKIDQDILVAQNTVTTAPLDISTSSITSGVCTVVFTVGNPMTYWSVGSKVYLTGFSPASGTLNGIQTISALNSTTISFNTTASGAVTVAANAIIESGVFRNITTPPVPGIPTSDQELVNLQTYLQSIISGLQNTVTTGSPAIITAAAKTFWIDPLDITTTGYVQINISVPDAITTDYFYQLYRSSISQATDAASLDDLVPSDELQLVYEGYPTAAEIAARVVIFNDVTPDEFRGANLYTNPATGEGALQSNDLPPFAKDINRFKNVVFYANTRTRHRLQLNLLGVETMLTDFNNGTIPKMTIISSVGKNDYTFVKGLYETTQFIAPAASGMASSGTASYLTINSANDVTQYYVWFKRGTAVDPALAGKIGILVEVQGGDSASTVAQKFAAAVAAYPWDFSSNYVSGSTVNTSTTEFGSTTNAAANTSGFTVTVTQDGVGEDAANKKILLSSQVSVALAVDETARSIVRVINKNSSEVINGFYLSGNNEVPGKMFFESKSVTDGAFYVIGNNANTGASFNPDISGDFTITSITTGSSPTVTTSLPHGLINGNSVVLGQTNSTPSVDGIYPIYQATSTTFKIDLSSPITVAATSGILISAANAAASENETKPNRIYYSKLSQPESVPIVNYFDVGDSDKAILRMFPLRDSLFVFKEEGLYRISGETAPFTLALFDSSCQLTAADTVDVNNNLVYCLSTQGVMTVSEGGVNIISRPIDNIILKIPVFTDYKTLSFGVGYESDNSYTLWTVQRTVDTCATIGFRYSNLTNTWTTIDREVTCGFINPVDDKSYYGAGDTNYIEQERKDFDRTDYAGRETEIDLLQNNYNGNQMLFTSVGGIEVGYVIAQTQQLTCYEFNMLLKKLDLDPSVATSTYYSTLAAVGGVSLRNNLEALATKLDADTAGGYSTLIAASSGTITSFSTAANTVITTSGAHNLLTGRSITIAASNCLPDVDGTWTVTVLSPTTFSIEAEVLTSGTSGTFTTDITGFDDISGCYNAMIERLNVDSQVSFSNYRGIDTTTVQEAIVIAVNRSQKRVTLNVTLEFVVGPVTLYESIDTAFTYGPNTFGNPVSFKHFRDATMMFESKAFTKASMQFATDLLPQLINQEFNGDGNGIFGHQEFGTGFFGGGSSAAPFRTYVPRQCQRARYLTVRFNHAIARESYKIFGTTLTGEDTASSRAYRG